jgi:hypothetical protein
MSNNTERLEAAGLIKKTPLPAAYQSVVDGLSEQELETLISITDRLRAMADVEAHGADDAPPLDELFIAL